ncbi:class I SAM-dependent methyltransferase [bacterium]|nr:class I SAM-dependent methyltransferase [bacterium]
MSSWLYHRFKNMARKPIGLLGRIMVRKLNGERHAVLADWGFTHLKVPENADCLDCGCGGGANIKRLLGMTKGRVFGVDFSKVAVAETKKFNKSEVKSGRCQVFLADVKKLPFEDGSFDVVTAFETVYYWENLAGCFKEILRVLKNGGVFMITSEAAGRIPENFEWEKEISGLRIRTGEEIKTAMESAGFTKILIDEIIEKDYICVLAEKS